MIRVVMHRNRAMQYTGFTVNGHAGFDAYGRDIVCAAVSALTTTTANSIEQLLKLPVSGEADAEEGSMRLELDCMPTTGTDLLFSSLFLGLSEIAEAYGPGYIRITTEDMDAARRTGTES